MTCPTLEAIAAWLLDGLTESENDSFEEHYFGCAACTERAERLEKLVSQLSHALPPALTPSRHAAMLAQQALPVVDVEPGQAATIRLSHAAPNGIWVMHFAPGAIDRLDVAARTTSGEPLFSMKDAPFDAERGHFYMPCSVHYREIVEGMPRFTVELSAVDLDGENARRLGDYVLDHELML